MHIVLPPSETKRDGGISLPLDYAALSFDALTSRRRMLVNAVVALANDEAASLKALKLGPKGAPEVARNKVIKKSPTMSAIERYTGVLFDGLDALTLDGASRGRASSHVLIHSALFGIVRADDPIPAYRLSHDSRIPALPLKAHWAAQNAQVLSSIEGLILDARSEAYVELGHMPRRDDVAFLRVVTRGGGGQVRALNHFNKKAKGEFTRSLLSLETAPTSVAELIVAARELGWVLEAGEPGELNLVV